MSVSDFLFFRRPLLVSASASLCVALVGEVEEEEEPVGTFPSLPASLNFRMRAPTTTGGSGWALSIWPQLEQRVCSPTT